MELETAIDTVGNFLHSGMGNTGVSGFEGLIAVLFQHATGQEFRLSSSGRQSGRDDASELGYGTNIKIEAKHYLERTPLRLPELLSKIDEATRSDPNLDIWVLAASRSIDEQTASSLDEHAERYGVNVVLLDFGINGLPRVAVLMAAYPGVVIAWANRNKLQYDPNAIRSALVAISNALGFEQAKTRLLAKVGGTVGYDSARRGSHKRLLSVLSDDRSAKSDFWQSLGIRTPDAHVVPRTGLNRQFDEWWNVSGVPIPAVALGEEGTGKTWAVFDWVARRVESGDMPILLPFAAVAQDVTAPDCVETLLANLLAKWTRVPDADHWKRRLHRWVSIEATGRPLMLLIVDGLNERANVHWRPFFSALLSAPWRERIAVLATDRPYHWRTKCSTAGFVTFRETTVNGYSDPELDQALSASNISSKDIPHELLPLISIPRYCRLVANHYQEMIALADFTRERLIYLEIKDRHASKLGYPLTDEQLFQIVRDLAESARVNPTLKPRDLRSLISVVGGDETTVYEEIVSGGLLVRVTGNGMTPSYRVDPLKLAAVISFST